MVGFPAPLRAIRAAMESSEPRFSIVIGQGRSGSTLILRLLNNVPGIRICGENARAMDHLQHFAECYRAAERNRHSDFYKLAWLAPCPHDEVMSHLRRLFVNLHGPAKLIGFKEIRYGYESYDEFASSLDWLRQLLPGLRIILNTRATDTAIHSDWWAKDPQLSRKMLDEMRQKFQRYHDAHRDCTYWMPYEELRHHSTVLRGMFEFLELPWDEEYEEPLDVVMR